MTRWSGVCAATMAIVAVSAPAQAATMLAGSDTSKASFSLGGYARTLAGVQLLRFDPVPAGTLAPPDHLGLSATILRAEWKLRVGERFSAELHQRGFLRITSDPLSLGGGLGIGVSAVPGRTLNLRTTAYDDATLYLDHDIDRLVAHVALGRVDLDLGRQAITWGTSLLFPIADLWTTFSPYELDTSQKRGVDAARAVVSLTQTLELDAIIADRGTVADLSAGARLTWYASFADLYLAVAKQWRELLVFSGLSATLGSFKLRGELAQPWALEDPGIERPRATLGADWIQPELSLTLEAHYNGTGVNRAASYLDHATSSPAVEHGVSYYLGRWYLGANASWKPSELLLLAATLLSNLRDPSAIAAASVTYRLSQDSQLSLGAYQGIGRRPAVLPTPQLRSELGSYGTLVYSELAAFF